MPVDERHGHGKRFTPVRGTIISCRHASDVSGFLRKRSAGSALHCISGGKHENSSVDQEQDTHGASVTGDEDHLLLITADRKTAHIATPARLLLPLTRAERRKPSPCLCCLSSKSRTVPRRFERPEIGSDLLHRYGNVARSRLLSHEG